MNSFTLLERRAVPAFARLAQAQQTRTYSAFTSIGLSPSRTFLRHRSPQFTKAQRALPRLPRGQQAGRWRYNSTRQSPDPTPHLGSPEPAPSLSQRLKQLSREYGWTAVGWYLVLSALDFPFCFLAVRALGTERIGQWEHAVVEFVKSIIRIPFPNLIKDTGKGTAHIDPQGHAVAREGGMGLDSELSQSAVANKDSDATIWTQLALAYAIHKSFIFVRVPLTAATLPRIVKLLRSWGWNIGKKSTK